MIDLYTTKHGLISNKPGLKPFEAPSFQNMGQVTCELINWKGIEETQKQVQAIENLEGLVGQYFRTPELVGKEVGQHQSLDELIAIVSVHEVVAAAVGGFLFSNFGLYPTTAEGTLYQQFLGRDPTFRAHLSICMGNEPQNLAAIVGWAYVMDSQCKKPIKDEDGWRRTKFLEESARKIGYRIDLCDKLKEARMKLGGIGVVRGNHWGDHNHPLAQEER